MVDLLFLGVLFLVVILAIEIFKHMVTKTFLKVIVFFIVGFIILIAVLNSLDKGDVLKTDNELVKTGAVIADTVSNQPITAEIKEKAKDIFNGLKERILNG